MALAVAAEDLSSFGKKADVVFEGNIFDIDRFDEAGPAGIGFEFGLGTEKRLSASCADISALFGGVPILSGKGFFSPFLAEKVVLFLRELFFPLIVGQILLAQLLSLLSFNCSKALKTSR